MISPDIYDAFSLEGTSYSRTELLRICEEASGDPGTPGWKKEVFDFIRTFLKDDGQDILQLTSGTTGTPREHKLSREAMTTSAQRTLNFLGLRPGQKALLCLPIRYIAGKMMVVRALVGGLDLRLVNPSGRPMQGMEGEVDFAAMVPLQVYESLRNNDPIWGIDKLLIGGGELPGYLQKELLSVDKPEVYLSFGMTETCTHFALRRLNGPSPDAHYVALYGVHLRTDPRGCLEVEVDGVTSGPVQTNDLVELDPSGRAFDWLGRYDHLINSGGIKIFPEKIEQEARKCTGRECLVLPEKDPKLGEKLVLVVEYKGDHPPVEDWLKCLSKALPAYEVPRKVLTMEEIPRNNSMKPDRTSAARTLL